MCYASHDVLHLGCRFAGLNYINVEEPDIKRLTLSFMDSEWCKRRAKKLELRKAAKQKPEAQPRRRKKKKKWKMKKKQFTTSLADLKKLRESWQRKQREGAFVKRDGRLIYDPT
jgi:hypothetical protein